MRSIYSAFFIYILFIMNANADVIEPNNVAVIILSQNEGYHAAQADYMRNDIYEQASALDKEAPAVVLTHELNIRNSWTITPLLVYLSDKFKHIQWFFFCEENTRIRLKELLDVFGKYRTSENVWIGHALYDYKPTIIHHFADYNKKLKYPHIGSGFAMTSTLVNSLSQEISEGGGPKLDFSIDASYEFASFVLNSTSAVKLTHEYKMCVVASSDCATYPRFFHSCNSIVESSEVYFAVKTCSKYHVERIPIIKSTWAKHTQHIGYFSDMKDKYLREAYVVPNTIEGHCLKTYTILHEAWKIMKRKMLNWLIISDDDTLFSVKRLLSLLTCYNSKNLIAIGDRYGFRMWDSRQGYSYLTGGAGIVLSAALVQKMTSSDICECPYDNAPDDMYLFGTCLLKLGVEPIHSPMFHQARPADYSSAYLASQEPISFHKFWMMQPEIVYYAWLETDNLLVQQIKHVEL